MRTARLSGFALESSPPVAGETNLSCKSPCQFARRNHVDRVGLPSKVCPQVVCQKGLLLSRLS